MSNVVRFRVCSFDGRRSADWRVWTGQERGLPKDDVYLAPSGQIVDFKVSLHPASGEGQHGLSKEIRGASRPGDRRALARWPLHRGELLPGWQVWYVIQFPDQELVAVNPPPGHGVIEIETAGTGRAISVAILVSDVETEIPGPDGGDAVVAYLERANGGRVAILALAGEFDADALEELERDVESQGHWEPGGMRAPQTPFGWAFQMSEEGLMWCIEIHGAGRSPSPPLELTEFPGIIRDWKERPPGLRHDDRLCAVLIVPPAEPPELFVDFRARCDHKHLDREASALVRCAIRGDIDEGWDRRPDGSLITGIATEASFARESREDGER